MKLTFANLEAKAVSDRALERRERLGEEWMRPKTDLQEEKKENQLYEVGYIHGIKEDGPPTCDPQMSQQPDKTCLLHLLTLGRLPQTRIHR